MTSLSEGPKMEPCPWKPPYRVSGGGRRVLDAVGLWVAECASPNAAQWLCDTLNANRPTPADAREAFEKWWRLNGFDIAPQTKDREQVPWLAFNAGQASAQQGVGEKEAHQQFRRGFREAARVHAKEGKSDLRTVLEEVEATLDDQLYEQMKAHDFDAPDDAEYTINITAELCRKITATLNRTLPTQHQGAAEDMDETTRAAAEPFKGPYTREGNSLYRGDGQQCALVMSAAEGDFICDTLNAAARAPGAGEKPGVTYDRAGDVLYVTFRRAAADHAEEGECMALRRFVGNELVGVTILNLAEQARSQLPSIGAEERQRLADAMKALCDIAHHAFHVLDEAEAEAIRETTSRYDVDALEKAFTDLTGDVDADPHEDIERVRAASDALRSLPAPVSAADGVLMDRDRRAVEAIRSLNEQGAHTERATIGQLLAIIDRLTGAKP